MAESKGENRCGDGWTWWTLGLCARACAVCLEDVNGKLFVLAITRAFFCSKRLCSGQAPVFVRVSRRGDVGKGRSSWSFSLSKTRSGVRSDDDHDCPIRQLKSQTRAETPISSDSRLRDTCSHAAIPLHLYHNKPVKHSYIAQRQTGK